MNLLQTPSGVWSNTVSSAAAGDGEPDPVGETVLVSGLAATAEVDSSGDELIGLAISSFLQPTAEMAIAQIASNIEVRKLADMINPSLDGYAQQRKRFVGRDFEQIRSAVKVDLLVPANGLPFDRVD